MQTSKLYSYLPNAIINAHVGPSLMSEEMRLLLLLLLLFSNMSLAKRGFLSCDIFLGLEHEANLGALPLNTY